MQLFSWAGVDWEGNDVFGVDFAVNRQELIQFLLNKQIGLVTAEKKRLAFVLSRPKGIDLGMVFSHVAHLLAAGIRLPHALDIVAVTVKTKQLTKMLRAVAFALHRGYQFDVALAQFPSVFSSFLCHAIHGGVQANRLPTVLEQLGKFYQQQAALRRQVRHLLLVPLITLFAFFTISFLLLVYAIPFFADMLQQVDTTQQPTGFVFILSAWLRSQSVLLWLGGTVWLMLFAKLISCFQAVKYWFAWLTLRLPIVGTILYRFAILQWLYALGVLLDGHISLTESLRMSANCVSHLYLQQRLLQVTREVARGETLQQALDQIVSEDLRAMLAVGEEVGDVSVVARRAAALYHAELTNQVATLLALLQPGLILLIGFFVAVLVVSVYLPMFQLSEAVYQGQLG